MAFEKLSYKTKFQALLLIFVMLAFAAYKRSFSSLVAVIKENRALTEKTKEIQDGTKNINVLAAEVTAIDKIIGKAGGDKEKIQQDLINFVTTFNSKISIYDLKSIHEFTDGNYTIYTNQLDVTGNLNQLLALSYEFEKKFNWSRLVNLSFYTVKKNNNPNVLHLKMIFQNYENNK